MKRAERVSKKTSSMREAEKRPVRQDALDMRDSIIASERVAADFFFVEMLPKMSALADSYNRSFGIDLKPDDVCCATYRSCWENDWAKLRAFKGETTIHAWVARIASQATYQLLVDEKYIDGSANSKTGDYRLTVRGIEDDYIRQDIVNMVFIPEQHKALELYYVKKCDYAALAKVFGCEEDARTILRTAENTLIMQLLNTENPYAEFAISTKKPVNPEVRFQSWHDRLDVGDVSENHQALREILASLYHNEDWDYNVERFIKRIVAEMNWTDMQKELWYERFFLETPSKKLAARYHVRNSWIDNTYCHLNKQFRMAVRVWWNQFAC